jgi:hypothetical protein
LTESGARGGNLGHDGACCPLPACPTASRTAHPRCAAIRSRYQA